MKMIHRVAVAFSILALTSADAALAEPILPPVGTLIIPSPFGPLPVAAWSWGASNSVTSGDGSGGGAGKASIQDLSIKRFVDGQSPLLFKAVATGLHLPSVALVDGPTTITLTDVAITGYSTGDSPPGNNGTRTENITFNFSKVDYTVNGVTACFNFTTNTSC
jgi:type VI protein secretion system component Hcp